MFCSLSKLVAKWSKRCPKTPRLHLVLSRPPLHPSRHLHSNLRAYGGTQFYHRYPTRNPEVSPGRMKSVRPQTRFETLVVRSSETSTQDSAGPQVFLPARRCVSVLRSERHPMDSTTVPNQGKGIDQQDDKHIQRKARRRTIWIPSDDTTILTIHPGFRSDARIPNDSSRRVVSQSGVGERRQRKPLAAAPKRAPLQPTLKPLQISEEQQGSYIPI